MLVTRVVDAFDELVGLGRVLLANEDREIVVRKVDTGVALSTDGCPEDDQILRDGRVQDDHRTHRTPGVVEHPVVGVELVDVLGPVAVDQLVGQALEEHLRHGVFACFLQSGLHDLLDLLVVKDVVGRKPRRTQLAHGVEHQQCKQRSLDEFLEVHAACVC